MMLQQNSQGLPNWAWKIIWRTKVPVKAAFLGWLAARDVCQTQNKLQRRGFSLSSRCYLSNSEEETVEHLFLHCRVSRQCWEHFLSITGISLVIPQKICNLLEIWQSQGVKGSLKQIWRTIPICIFEGKRLQIPRVKNECIKKLYFWCYSSTIDRMDQYLEFLHFLGDNM